MIATLRLALAAAALSGAAPAAPPPDLILDGARVWTGEARQPIAQAVAVRGDRIVAVGRSRDVLRLSGPATRVVALPGRLVVPGFIDAHTHFEEATQWFFEAYLFDAEDAATVVARVKEAAARVPPDYWITAIDWGGAAARRHWAKGDRHYGAPPPDLAAIDAITPGRPVLLRRSDGAVFANSEALARLRIVAAKPDPAGGAYGRDARTGALDGMLYGTAATAAWDCLPPVNERQTQVAARALVHQLNGYGITGIHDIARVDALSQSALFRTAVERGHSDLRIFQDLRAAGALTVRVYPLLVLRDFAGLAALGITPGSGDDLIRFGALKAFVDGSLTDEPWRNHPAYSGDFTMRVVDERTMRDDTIAADRAGFDVAMHVFGDKAQRLLLDWYDAAIAANPPRDRRFRLIHAWWPRLDEIRRAGRIGAVADITPWQMLTGWRAAEAMLPPDVLATAYGWQTMRRLGVRLDLVSDWPGSYDRSDRSPVDPLVNIYYAVTRHEIGEPPSRAWHPAEALSMDEALAAYTINPAWASHEEAIKGSIAVGKLADLVVLSEDVTRGPPERLLRARVLWTLFGGRTVAGGPPGASHGSDDSGLPSRGRPSTPSP